MLQEDDQKNPFSHKLNIPQKKYLHLIREKNELKHSNILVLLELAIEDCDTLILASIGKSTYAQFIIDREELLNKKNTIIKNEKYYYEQIEKFEKLIRSNERYYLSQAMLIINDLIEKEIYPRKNPKLFQKRSNLERDMKNLNYK